MGRRVPEALLTVCFIAVFVTRAGAQASGESLLTPEALADRLSSAQEERIDLELKTGKSFLRCKLLRLDRVRDGGPPDTIRLEDGETGKILTINFASIRSVVLGREKVYEAGNNASASSGQIAKAEQDLKAAAEERAEWVARATANGAKPWPEMSNEEHEAAVAELRKLITKTQQLIPGVDLYETHEFLFCSNMPRAQVLPYAASLDKMHDMMCDLYGIKKGTPVWRGKCLVMAFLNQQEFQRFEAENFQNLVPSGVYGLCHQFSSGRVIISCYRGDDPHDFGQMLVHETSHGFNFRYRTSERLPSWVNEGLAEVIGQSLVPASKAVPRKEQLALAALQSTHSVQGLFVADPIDSIQYGMASHINGFMLRADKKKYVDFINGMKEGKDWQKSLSDAFGATPEQLASAYGRSIGIPDLRP